MTSAFCGDVLFELTPRGRPSWPLPAGSCYLDFGNALLFRNVAELLDSAIYLLPSFFVPLTGLAGRTAPLAGFQPFGSDRFLGPSLCMLRSILMLTINKHPQWGALQPEELQYTYTFRDHLVIVRSIFLVPSSSLPHAVPNVRHSPERFHLRLHPPDLPVLFKLCTLLLVFKKTMVVSPVLMGSISTSWALTALSVVSSTLS